MSALPESVLAWAAKPREVCSGGVWARDNRRALEAFEKIVSVRPAWRTALLQEAGSHWYGCLASAVLEAQDGRVAGVPRREVRALFRDGWELSPTTPDERERQEAIDAAEASAAAARLAEWKAGAAARAAAETAGGSHTKYDDCPGNGVW